MRFGERLPTIRTAMAEDMDREHLDRARVCAIALRLINLGWFRAGSERYAKESRTYGITTLRKRHVTVRGSRIALNFRGKHKVWVRTAVLDAELADALKELIALRGGRGLFRYRGEDGELVSLDRSTAQPIRTGAHGRRLHGQGLPYVGRHAPRGDRPRRARRRGRGETQAKKNVAAVLSIGRGEAREHAGRVRAPPTSARP